MEEVVTVFGQVLTVMAVFAFFLIIASFALRWKFRWVNRWFGRQLLWLNRRLNYGPVIALRRPFAESLVERKQLINRLRLDADYAHALRIADRYLLVPLPNMEGGQYVAIMRAYVVKHFDQGARQLVKRNHRQAPFTPGRNYLNGLVDSRVIEILYERARREYPAKFAEYINKLPSSEYLQALLAQGVPAEAQLGVNINQ